MMNEELTPFIDPPQPSNALLVDLREIIRRGKSQAVTAVNSALTLTFWHVGKRINEDVLQGERAAYGQQVIAPIAESLVEQFGKSFEVKNLHRMMQFAVIFTDLAIVVPLARQLSWAHILILIPLKTQEARMYYAEQASQAHWGKRELRRQIERKAYERAGIADRKMEMAAAPDLAGSFKDPYFFDFLDLPQGYLEDNLEQGLIRELEQFILELGKGFAFVERQKRMIIDGEDFYLDLLFYHRRLKRLVAIELKIDRFKAAHKGQMELYLNWLDRYERQPDEAAPIGLILCAQAGSEQVELMNLQKDNILVAEYWTELPPKEVLEKKLHSAFLEIQTRLSERKKEEADQDDVADLKALETKIKRRPKK
jgi:predicted nuclease of restriction endonuclease-like (RecB) superfamily